LIFSDRPPSPPGRPPGTLTLIMCAGACLRALHKALRPQAAAARWERLLCAVDVVARKALAAAACRTRRKREVPQTLPESGVRFRRPDLAEGLLAYVAKVVMRDVFATPAHVLGMVVKQRQAGADSAVPADDGVTLLHKPAVVVAPTQARVEQADAGARVECVAKRDGGCLVDVQLGQADVGHLVGGAVRGRAERTLVQDVLLHLRRVRHHVRYLDL